MAAGMLPEEGELRLGPVTLPAGERIYASLWLDDPAGTIQDVPVAWATIQKVPEPGRVWATLSGAHRQTGLVAFCWQARTRPRATAGRRGTSARSRPISTSLITWTLLRCWQSCGMAKHMRWASLKTTNTPASGGTSRRGSRRSRA